MSEVEILGRVTEIQNAYLNAFTEIRETLHILPMPKTVRGEERKRLRNDLLDIEHQTQMFLNYLDEHEVTRK